MNGLIFQIVKILRINNINLLRRPTIMILIVVCDVYLCLNKINTYFREFLIFFTLH